MCHGQPQVLRQQQRAHALELASASAFACNIHMYVVMKPAFLPWMQRMHPQARLLGWLPQGLADRRVPGKCSMSRTSKHLRTAIFIRYPSGVIALQPSHPCCCALHRAHMTASLILVISFQAKSCLELAHSLQPGYRAQHLLIAN